MVEAKNGTRNYKTATTSTIEKKPQHHQSQWQYAEVLLGRETSIDFKLL